MYSVNVCVYMRTGMLQVVGKAGAGVAVHSKVNRATFGKVEATSQRLWVN